MSPALLALNNAFAEELSFLSPETAESLIGKAFMAARVGEADALRIAFDQDAAYDNANFRWFKARFPRFVYVDRVVVAPAAQPVGSAALPGTGKTVRYFSCALSIPARGRRASKIGGGPAK